MNIVYNASAGTGKTYQVTHLYEKLVLEDGVDPREILLMTFTENAAAELRLRVTQRLLKARRTAEAAGDDDQAGCAMLALSRLPSAPIGTIHSYCTRLLREQALDAGRSPGFAVLDEDERTQILDQIGRDALLRQLGSDPDFKAFCAGAQVIGTGKGFGVSVTETIPKLINQAGSLGISLENAEAMLPPPESTGTIQEFYAILTRLQALPKPTAKAKPFIQALEELLPTTHDLETLIEALTERGLKGKKFGGGSGHKPISDDFFELFNRTDAAIQYRKRFPAAQAFARYVQTVAARFQQRKHEMDAVDFDDQLRMAAELLKSGKAAPDFRYVIVDEVQDTSRIQCDLIQSLWGEDTQLVICGDKKQSIYTWRGADPQVMPDLQQMILDAGGTLKNLQTSYRSKKPIIDVVNTLFSTVFDPADYAEGDRLEARSDAATEAEKPCIEFLGADGDTSVSKQEKIAGEMEAVANRIQLLIHGSDPWRPNFRYSEEFLPTSDTNAYRYSDILILLRRTTHQPALEHALRHAGIPYTLGGKGRGLFSRQETRDVALFLNVLTNPKDVYSLIGFLRSPWIGLSDETLAELAWSEEGFSVDNLLAAYPSHTDIIDRYRALLSSKLASELVRMLIDETGYDALLAGLPRGPQRLANLRKVLDWLREIERGARTTPAAAARKLATQIARPPKIPEAVLLDPAQNAVTIMTVHGAKGLTKRVVFLPDMSSGLNNDTAFAHLFFDDRNTPKLGLKITAPDKSSVASPGFPAARERAKSVREQESNNLFYVAMTRARDLVVTSATVGSSAAGWYQKMEPLIGTDIPIHLYSSVKSAVQEELPATSISTVASANAEDLVAALKTLPPAPEKPARQRIPATRLAKEQGEAEPEFGYGPAENPSMDHAAAMGSLGHAVLEHLALNAWEGSVKEWLETLHVDFKIKKQQAGSLLDRIEKTRDLMRELTAGMRQLRPELPFVIDDNGLLVDGTIDLLCSIDRGYTIYDYKFTEAADDVLAERYRSQMNLYRKAADKLFPQATPSTCCLVVVSEAAPRLVPLVF